MYVEVMSKIPSYKVLDVRHSYVPKNAFYKRKRSFFKYYIICQMKAT